MQIKLSVSAKDHHDILSSLVGDLTSSPFSDVTLVCEDGQLIVNRIALVLVKPPLGALELGEAPLLLLPHHSLQEIQEQLMLSSQEQKTGEEQEAEKKQEIYISEEQTITFLEDIFAIEEKSNVVQEEPELAVICKPIYFESTLENQRYEEEDVNSGYGLDDVSPDEEDDDPSNKFESKYEYKQLIGPAHVSKEELKHIQSRYMKGNPHASNKTGMMDKEMELLQVKIMPQDICNMCGHSFAYRNALITHKKNKHNINDFSELYCTVEDCPYKGRSEKLLKLHMIYKHHDTKLECEECKVYLRSKKALQNHNNKYHLVTPCRSQCGQEFRSKKKESTHHRIVRGNCATGRKTRTLRQGEQKAPLPCSICGNVFAWKNGLREHMRNIHKAKSVKKTKGGGTSGKPE